MKKLSILALSATVAIAPAFAETGVNYNTPSVDVQPAISFDVSQQPALPTTAQADLSFAFGDVENFQTTDMTLAEMQETEGAALPPMAIYYGAVYGVPAIYAGARWASGNGPQLLSNRIRHYLNK